MIPTTTAMPVAKCCLYVSLQGTPTVRIEMIAALDDGSGRVHKQALVLLSTLSRSAIGTTRH